MTSFDRLFQSVVERAATGILERPRAYRGLTAYQQELIDEALATYVETPEGLMAPDEETTAEREVRQQKVAAYRRAVLRRKDRPDWSVKANAVEDLDPIREMEEQVFNGGSSRVVIERMDPCDLTVYCGVITEQVFAAAEGEESVTPEIEEAVGRWKERHGDLGDAVALMA